MFTSKQAPLSAEQQRLLEELVSLSDRLSLEVHDMDTDAEAVGRYAVEFAPCTIVTGKRDYGVRFYGLTVGHELASLLETMLMVSNSRSGPQPAAGRLGQTDRSADAH